jgi:hypothetical protein
MKQLLVLTVSSMKLTHRHTDNHHKPIQKIKNINIYLIIKQKEEKNKENKRNKVIP